MSRNKEKFRGTETLIQQPRTKKLSSSRLPQKNSVDLEKLTQRRRATIKEHGHQYAIENIEHALFTDYQLTYINKGSEKLVYESEKHPNIVIKAEIEPIKEYLHTSDERFHQETREYMARKSARFSELKKYFGKDHVHNQKQFAVTIPMNPQLYFNIFQKFVDETVTDARTIITVQKKAIELTDKRCHQIVSYYAENQDNLAAAYKENTRKFIYNSAHKDNVTSDEMLLSSIQPPESSLPQLLDACKHNTDMRASLREFTARAAIYTNNTGEILDILGGGNVTLFPDGKTWSYKLIDAVHPIEKAFIITKQALPQLDENLNTDGKTIIANTINYTRTINGLASHFGLSERLDLIPDELKDEKMIDFEQLLRE